MSRLAKRLPSLIRQHAQLSAESARWRPFDFVVSAAACLSTQQHQQDRQQQDKDWRKAVVRAFPLTAAAAAIFALSAPASRADETSAGGQWPRPAPSSPGSATEATTNNPLEYDPVTNEHTANMTIARSAALDYYQAGKYDKAEAKFKEAVSEARLGFDKTDPHIASCLNNLAELYRNTRQFKKAEELYCEAIEQLEVAYGEKHWLYVSALHNLALCLDGQGNLEGARAAMERVVALRHAMFGGQHFLYADAMFALGGILRRQDGAENERQALVLMKDSIEILEDSENVQTAVVLAWLSELSTEYQRRGRAADAVLCVRKAMYHLGNDKGEVAAQASQLSDNLVELLLSSGRLTEAVAAMRTCCQARAELFGGTQLVVAQSVLRLATLEARLGTEEGIAAALQHATDAAVLAEANLQELTKKSGGFGSWLVGSVVPPDKQLKRVQAGHILGSALKFAGAALLEAGRPDDAEVKLEQSVNALQAAFGSVQSALAQQQAALSRAASGGQRQVAPPGAANADKLVDTEELVNLYIEVQFQLLEALDQLVAVLSDNSSKSKGTKKGNNGTQKPGSTGVAAVAAAGKAEVQAAGGTAQLGGSADVAERLRAERIAALQQRSEALAKSLL